MNRDEAIELARKHAIEASKKEGAMRYLQLSDHPEWMPHDWVINAILEVADDEWFKGWCDRSNN